ncbi:MerR family transcriptional regulator [Parasedimentitalea huanghaiensis]|uniref:MerR family transcriptional regulator n=1 Tax=Parasedimentitalea huanghaiensis TaxID=2682100 RepID=A0A6L6WLP1_9RHOB|nr:MerR family transcriptional regulator [Zongyanglinia huanghaiensis]MVO18594.1 MerR family transcriptional regulator [Zongyanglinia huanghaiensis]
MRPNIFENDRVYDDSDIELDVIAPRTKRAQWRHRRVGPNFLRFGRRIKYHGADLNVWVDQVLVVNENSTA